MSYDLMSKSMCKHLPWRFTGIIARETGAIPPETTLPIQISSADVDHDSDFNFNRPKLDRCASLDDPLSESYDYDSPADRLFVNGVLLPLQFPIPRSNTQNSHHRRLMMSCIGSGESSIGGGSSSASTRASSLASSRSSRTNGEAPKGKKRYYEQSQGRYRLTESQRWQVIVTPVPRMGAKAKATAHNRNRTGEAGDRLLSRPSVDLQEVPCPGGP